jgi:ferredoxin
MIRRAARAPADHYRFAMATPTERNPDNVPGPYYVDSSCIDCDQCRVMAPDLFARNPDTGLGYVKRQPLTEDEVALAEETVAACATSSIGNDGV